MRTKKEVQAEIDWREKEIESINTEIKNHMSYRMNVIEFSK